MRKPPLSVAGALLIFASSIFWILVMTHTGGCAHAPGNAREASATAASAAGSALAAPSPFRPQLSLTHGDGSIGAFTSGPRGFSTRSYWIEGPQGLILIDTQFLLSEAATFVDWAEKVTGKKAVLAIVLHPNPDKFNGAHVLKQRGIRVLTSDQVKALIPSVHQDRYDAFYERFKPDYPTTAPELESFGGQTRDLEAAGTKIKLHVLGAGASGAHVVVEYRQQLFVGDLIGPGTHAWLELGLVDEWLARLKEMRALEPAWIFPGRGAPGGPWILDDEEIYLKKVRNLVAAERPRKGLNEEERDRRLERVQKKMAALYPTYDYLNFLELGLPAIWDRMAR